MQNRHTYTIVMGACGSRRNKENTYILDTVAAPWCQNRGCGACTCPVHCGRPNVSRLFIAEQVDIHRPSEASGGVHLTGGKGDNRDDMSCWLWRVDMQCQEHDLDGTDLVHDQDAVVHQCRGDSSSTRTIK